ncbi:fibronectin type III domain-containing protein [[Ruminococcus] gnavus]|uniref:Fibronectin type III domain-containing protein n=3 Tax=Mediterraneibacter gnavus TaxID=33038 RepID=A0A415S9L0_MEDGN|nr:fibronectin type III domain-containing protein [Mediterraneibacter gnavus]MDU2007535.1 fibronectin type III domain-containing protein [Lachnospiraceae bacterium]MDB8680759.1 fibronectin type III domain-containing protein [Mediterraneibacter gnavus]MDB8687821.1 fibronectin type III domain-containing protein [Mediterraneibacter gnavus]MDB8691915.1 fibronectin type III domain-containing protein [Mediterraneibacter gnavus]MDU2033881.1 fibronectin type III domain-containing protein [Lachnospirac
MRKKWMSSTLALVLAGTTVASMMPAVPVSAKGAEAASGTTYYVDSKKGKDSNAGTSESEAFQTLDKVNELDLNPGDTILLKKGSVFEDQALKFTKEDSGTAEAPVKVSTYGEGDRPQINTNGHGLWELNYGTPLDNQNHKWKGTVSSSILIEDAEYLEIEGLELTNDRKSTTDTEKDKAYNDAYAMDRTGVAGVAKDNGTVDHIVLNDLYIHDVTGNVYNKHMTNGGIYFIVAKPTNEGETGIARYNDVQIRNCSLDTVNRWGIAVGYTYQWRQFETGELPDATMAKYGSSNVVIENNYLNHVGGDAITTMYLDRPLIQYNVSENAAEQINTKDYSKNQPSLDANGNPNGTQGVGAGRVAAGIWPWKCKNAIFQYNECFKTLNAASGNGDGQPWDADYGDGTNYQYNYSHGNTASTIMFCGVNSVNNTFRYNISQNEDMGPLDPAGNSGNCQVYNNTFYIKEGLDTIWSTVHRNNGPVDMENNIFYFAGKTPVTVRDWNPENRGNKTYSNNLYYNITNLPSDAAAVKVDAGTQVLVDAGSGPDSVATDKAARKHENPTEETVFDGYKLAENSPAINKGKVVVDRNGYTIDHDFFGHAITAVPEIGAAESDAVAETLILRSNVYKVAGTNVSELPKNTTVDAFLKNIIVDTGVKVTVKDGEKVLKGTDVVKGGATIVLSYEGKTDVTYTVVASSDKELKASYYEVRGTELEVPYTEKNPTTVKELKASLTVADTATVSVVNAGKELADKDAVADGMTLRITAEDGTTKEYAIKQKNEYNWTKDFINGQQGNVWFGQMKDGSGDWVNMTSVDKDGWPNWATHTYYGPGIDDDQHVTTASSPDKHGLLSAPPSTNISTAMAYRVPKSGTVSFKVRDNEPYLRQNDNAGGTVTLSLYVNGTEKKNLTLETSKKKEGNWEKAEEIEVTRGDMIRVVAKCNGNPSKPSAHITPIITYVDKAAADKEAPTVPADVKASEIAHTGAKLTWTASKDNVEVAGYNVYLNNEKVNDELITGTEYDLADLTANTEYNVTVTAVDAAGNESEKSEAATFTTEAEKDTEAPTAPTEVKATEVTETTAKVTWSEATDNVGVVGYNVYLNETKVNDTLVTGTEYALTELTEATEYAVRVTAVDAAENESARSEAATFTTLKKEEPKDTEAPSVPTAVAAADITQTTAKVTWDASTDNVGVVGYNVYVNEAKVNASPVTVTEYDLTGLTEATEYTVRVTAVDAAENESARSEAVTFTTLEAEEETDTEAPTAPAEVKATEVTETTAKLTWNEATDNVGVAGYNVYVNEAKVNEELVAGTEFALTDLTEATEYTVRVSAVDAAGNESARSEATTFTTLESEKPAPEKPAAPTNVKISEIKHTKALVTWDSVLARAAVEGYNVYLDGEKVNATPVKETRYELTGLKVGTKYNVAVTAVNEEGTESEITEEVEETFITMADMEKLNNTVEDAKKALEEKEKYTEESLKKLQEVYKQYQDVLNGENVTQEQVDEANAAIEKAFKDLKVKETADDKKDDNKKPAAGGGSTGSGSTGGGSTGSGTTGSGSAGKGSSSITSPKTGDTMNVAAWALAFAASAAAAGTVVVKRKKED